MNSATVGVGIMVDSQNVDEPPRKGTILEIVEHEYGTSYRVAWDDGHESTFRPTAGTVHTVHPSEPETASARRLAAAACAGGACHTLTSLGRQPELSELGPPLGLLHVLSLSVVPNGLHLLFMLL